jgi:hypothetical protein
MDISGALSKANINLEAKALSAFGAAVKLDVTDFGPWPPTKLGQQNNNSAPADRIWNPTKYAAALASGDGGFDPKTKFLFKVKFSFQPAVRDMMSALGVDSDELSRNLTFTVKNIDLPKIDFEYETVNMYNFRTKVLKSISNRQIAMSFYDDVANNAVSFANIYLMLLMPITRMQQDPSPTARPEDFGFSFSMDNMSRDTSYRGVLPNGARDAISEMVIEQFYVERNSSAGSRQQVAEHLVKMNSYSFINPRLVQIDLSDQDHENGNSANIISTSFDFDALRINVREDATRARSPSLDTGDILNNVSPLKSSLPSQQGGQRDPYSSSPMRAAVQQAPLSQPSQRTPIMTPGGAEGATEEITGALGTAANRTLKNVTRGISQGIAVPKIAFVTDGTVSAVTAAVNSARQKAADIDISKLK